MKRVRTFLRPEQIEFFLRLHGLWEGVISLPRPPPPPFDIETMEPVEPPWQAVKEWIPDDAPDLNWFNQERQPKGAESESYDQLVRRSLGEGVSPTWQPNEIPLGDGRILILEDETESREAQPLYATIKDLGSPGRVAMLWPKGKGWKSLNELFEKP